jgi:hypothetical protein
MVSKMLNQDYETSSFCYWADRTKSVETISRTRVTTIKWLKQIDKVGQTYTNKKCVVYVAINKINNKLYVGATKLTRDERRRSHLYNARTNVSGKFYTALRKYGPEAFEFITFAKCKDFMHVLEVERSLIDAIRPEYNLTMGGGGALGCKRSEEAKKKI